MKECFPSAQAVHFLPSPPTIRGVSVMFPTHARCFEAGATPVHACKALNVRCIIMLYHQRAVQMFPPANSFISVCPVAAVCSFFLRLIFLMIGCSTPENNSALVWHSFSTPLPPTSPRSFPCSMSCSSCAAVSPLSTPPSGKDMRVWRCWEAPLPGGFSDCGGGLWWWKVSRPGLRWIPCRQAGTQTGSH